MIYSGIFSLSLWGVLVSAFVMTHVTIAAVTIYLHRAQCHRALVLHTLPSHFFRLWLWLTTGMVTRQWIAVHRKHHAKSETADDPHSPRIFGIHRVLWGGMLLYAREAKNLETITRYGGGAPSDWLERRVYSAHSGVGILLMPVIDIALFGLLPGMLVYGIQMAWIPFLAAGVVNGLGHHSGYRSYACNDASTNIFPWGILIGGEELHNNHHAFVTSAKLSTQWYEFDIGWMYIRVLALCGLAKVKRVAPSLRMIPGKSVCDLVTLEAIITHRFDVLMKYNLAVKSFYTEDIRQAEVAICPEGSVRGGRETLDSIRQELSALWEDRLATREDLVLRLQRWCVRAEASAFIPLQRFARELRCYS